MTEAEIALDLLDEAQEAGVKFACVVADADYGDNPNFLNGLAQRGQRCVAAIRKDFQVALKLTVQSRPQRAEQMIAGQRARHWAVIRWRDGHGKSLKAQFTALRCWRVDGDGKRHAGWLIGERPCGEPQGEHHYYWSDLPPRTPLEVMVEYAHRRCWVEQYHEEAKGELGWDQHQGRVWESFHRHAATVMLAYSFLVWLEFLKRLRQRRGGFPRAAFSPSPRRASGLAAGSPSHSRRVAARRDHQ